MNTQFPEGAAPLLRLSDVRKAMIQGVHVPSTAEAFVEVTSPSTRDVRLSGNQVPDGVRMLTRGAEVPEDAVTIE